VTKDWKTNKVYSKKLITNKYLPLPYVLISKNLFILALFLEYHPRCRSYLSDLR